MKDLVASSSVVVDCNPVASASLWWLQKNMQKNTPGPGYFLSHTHFEELPLAKMHHQRYFNKKRSCRDISCFDDAPPFSALITDSYFFEAELPVSVS